MSLGKCGCTNWNHVLCMGVAVSVRRQIFFLKSYVTLGNNTQLIYHTWFTFQQW